MATGGGDMPEDVLGALNRAAAWPEWSARAKFIVLIADSPGHGTDLNDDPNDAHQNGVQGLTTKAVMTSLQVFPQIATPCY